MDSRTLLPQAYEHVKRERTLAVLERLFYEADEDGTAGVLKKAALYVAHH